MTVIELVNILNNIDGDLEITTMKSCNYIGVFVGYDTTEKIVVMMEEE